MRMVALIGFGNISIYGLLLSQVEYNIEQTVDVIFDSGEKKCKYSVNTVFETSNGGIYSTRGYCE